MELHEFGIGLVLLLCASAAKDTELTKLDSEENYADMMKHFGNLETEIQGMKNYIQKMEKLVKEQTIKIQTQDDRIEKQSNEIELLKQEIVDSKEKVKTQDNTPKKIQNHLDLHDGAHKIVASAKKRRYLLSDAGDTQFGFSAYLDHNINGIGINQTIIFNTNLFNDGGAYNNASGIYTCPVNGVYLFFFAVGSGSKHQIVAKLVTNGVNQVDAIADSEYHDDHEGHASNMVILRLAAGTHVWVENYRWTTHFVEGGKTDRFTTFSGVLLYQ